MIDVRRELTGTRILVTGANGFVGRHLCLRLLQAGCSVRALFRQAGRTPPAWDPFGNRIEVLPAGDLSRPEIVWEPYLQNIDAVISLAARSHVMHDSAPDRLAEYRRVNVTATGNLADAVGRSGVRRLIYVSSIKVNGEQTSGVPYTENDTPHPIDPYGRSKVEAEEVVRKVAENRGFEVTIIRPPLVYGPGVRANFLRFMRHIHRGLPLVLPSSPNKRSMVGVRNLADLLLHCTQHPRAAHQTFLVSDGEDVSTLLLAQTLGRYLGRPARVWQVPTSALLLASKLVNKREQIRRMAGSLEISIRKVSQLLEWHPPQSFQEGIRETVEWYLHRK